MYGLRVMYGLQSPRILSGSRSSKYFDNFKLTVAEYPPSRIALGPPGPPGPQLPQPSRPPVLQPPLRQGDAVWGGEEALHGLAVAGNLQDHHLVACELSLVEAPRLPTGG